MSTPADSTVKADTGESAGKGRNLPTPLWQQAAAFASRKHCSQIRKDGKTPYVSHVFRVAMTLRDCFGCDDQAAICAALLHDTIEDTNTDFDDIEEGFGIEIAHLVAALTKNMLLREPEREVDYDQRLAQADWRARLVKLADVYDNLCDIPNRKNPDPGALERMLSRCERAVALARADLATLTGNDRQIVEKAIDIVESAAGLNQSHTTT